MEDEGSHRTSTEDGRPGILSSNYVVGMREEELDSIRRLKKQERKEKRVQ